MMNNTESPAVFESKQVRRFYNKETDTWYFSIVDIIEVLSDSVNPTDYLKKLRKRDSELGSYIGTNCPQVEMIVNGKKRNTLGGTVKDILRIIQSIPSPKAEPFKLWLAKVGYERMQEISDPEQGLERARENWQKLGRSEKWIQQRMSGQSTRNKLTDYWSNNGVKKGDEFAFLTNLIHAEWTGLTIKKHKALKGLKSQNLRDHMSEAELIFTALAELSTRAIAETDEAKGLYENAEAGKKGGKIAKNARLALEAKTGKKIVTSNNFLPPKKENKKLKK
jgi:DNA-damage-inducible protein D